MLGSRLTIWEFRQRPKFKSRIVLFSAKTVRISRFYQHNRIKTYTIRQRSRTFPFFFSFFFDVGIIKLSVTRSSLPYPPRAMPRPSLPRAPRYCHCNMVDSREHNMVALPNYGHMGQPSIALSKLSEPMAQLTDLASVLWIPHSKHVRGLDDRHKIREPDFNITQHMCKPSVSPDLPILKEKIT